MLPSDGIREHPAHLPPAFLTTGSAAPRTIFAKSLQFLPVALQLPCDTPPLRFHAVEHALQIIREDWYLLVVDTVTILNVFRFFRGEAKADLNTKQSDPELRQNELHDTDHPMKNIAVNLCF